MSQRSPFYLSRLFPVTIVCCSHRPESNRIESQHAVPCHCLVLVGLASYPSLGFGPSLVRYDTTRRDDNIFSLVSTFPFSLSSTLLCREAHRQTPLREKGKKKKETSISGLFPLISSSLRIPCLALSCIILTRSSRVPGDAGTIGKRDKWLESLVPFSSSLDAFIPRLSLL